MTAYGALEKHLDGFRRAKTPKMRLSGPQDTLKPFQDAPKTPQDAPKTPKTFLKRQKQTITTDRLQELPSPPPGLYF